MGDATVWAQAESGQWERIGADRVRGVWPEGLRATANDWGSDTCSFLVRRDPGAIFPDLLPFTPIDVEVGGEIVWSGRVWEPPQQADERAIAVECRGWQYHLDDDLVDRLYVHSRLESWRDTRTFLGVVLTDFPEEPTAGAGDGVLLLGWGDGTTTVLNTQAGAMLDLGPGVAAKRVVITYEFTAGMTAGWSLRVTGHDGARYDTSNPENAIDFACSSSGSGTAAGTFATAAHRFVTIRLVRTGATGACAGDALVRVTSVQVFRETAYESGNASVLKASDVVKDLLPFCPLLDQRTDLIQTSDVVLPDFVLEDQAPRQGMEQANTVDGMQQRVTPERLLEYRPRPIVPIFKVGKWAGENAGLSGVSRGSGEPIHNRVVVKGNDSSGGRVVVDRLAAQLLGVRLEAIDSPAADNPTFDANVASWQTTFGGTLNRDLVIFDSSPASLIWDGAPEGSALTETFTGTFVRGVPYVLGLRLRANNGGWHTLDLGHLASGDIGSLKLRAGTDFPLATWVSIAVAWMPQVDRASGVKLRDTVNGHDPGSALKVWVDSLGLSRAVPTLADRRGFRRSRAIKVGRPITVPIGTGMADAALRESMRTPFKGDATADRTVVRTFLGDQSVHPGHLLRHTGELLHHSHLIDPDNGNLGRDSRIVTVTYDDEAVVSAIGLDNTRSDFETQLAKYEVTGRR